MINNMNHKLLAWSSDTHFNLTTAKRIKKFCKEITHEDDCIGLILTGDIAESDSTISFLTELHKQIKVPIYFVLGNHDFYKSDIATVTQNMINNLPVDIHWLTRIDYIRLNDTTCIVGNENWWDGRAGSLRSLGLLDGVLMAPDYILIGDIAWLSKEQRFEKLRELADLCTQQIIMKLSNAFRDFEEVILCVHVPPFAESCDHGGKPMTDNLLPHFTSKALGDALVEFMSIRKEKKLTVLAGHTHENTVYKPLKNLTVKVANASYFSPKVHKFIKI